MLPSGILIFTLIFTDVFLGYKCLRVRERSRSREKQYSYNDFRRIRRQIQEQNNTHNKSHRDGHNFTAVFIKNSDTSVQVQTTATLSRAKRMYEIYRSRIHTFAPVYGFRRDKEEYSSPEDYSQIKATTMTTEETSNSTLWVDKAAEDLNVTKFASFTTSPITPRAKPIKPTRRVKIMRNKREKDDGEQLTSGISATISTVAMAIDMNVTKFASFTTAPTRSTAKPTKTRYTKKTKKKKYGKDDGKPVTSGMGAAISGVVMAIGVSGLLAVNKCLPDK